MSRERFHVQAALVLGCLAAIGPFSIDAYLPAMPAMAHDLATDAGTIQLTLMTFFVGLTVGQLFYGPLSDRHGRKPLILVGLTIYTIASAACAAAPTVGVLIAARLCQGLGGSIGMVMAIAVVRDLFTGHAAVRLMALIISVMGVAPVVAPLVGSAALAVASWKAVFWVLTAFGLFDILLVALLLPETRMPELRTAGSLRRVLSHYGSLITSRRCIPFVLALAVAQAGFFAFISGSPDVFVTHYGISPSVYSMIFAVDAAALAVAGRANAPAVRRWGFAGVVLCALAVYTAAAAVAVASIRFSLDSTAVLAVATFFVIVSIGFVIPSLNTVIMESYGAIAGTAAAVIGAFQFAGGAVASAVVGRLSDGTAAAMSTVIVWCGVVALLLSAAAFALRGRREAPAPTTARNRSAEIADREAAAGAALGESIG